MDIRHELSALFLFICSHVTQGAITCIDGSTLVPATGTCVRLVSTPASWMDAVSTCRSYGMELGRIDSQQVQENLQSLMEQNSISMAWLGAELETGNSNYAWRYVRPCQTCPYKLRSCTSSVDIVFMVDTSESMNSGSADQQKINWLALKEYIKNFIRTMNLEVSSTRVALVKFSASVTVEFHLNDYTSTDDILKQVDSLMLEAGIDTDTTSALDLLRTSIFTPQNGDRPDNKNIAVMLTDGNPSNEGTLFEAVSNVHNAGITVYTVGLGSVINEANLKQISSSPQTKGENYLVLGDFMKLENYVYVDDIVTTFCSAFQDVILTYPTSEERRLLEQGCYTGALSSARNLEPVNPSNCAASCFKDKCAASCFKDDGVYYSGVYKINVFPYDACACDNNFPSGVPSTCSTDCDGQPGVLCLSSGVSSVRLRDGAAGHWAQTQPNNIDGDQMCGTLDTFGNQVLLADEACHNHYRYMCQLPTAQCDILGASGSIDQMTKAFMCQDYTVSNSALLGYTKRYLGQCFFLSRMDRRLTWFQARQACRYAGGELFVNNNNHPKSVLTSWLDNIRMMETNDCSKPWSHEDNKRHLWIGLFKKGYYWREQSTTGGAGSVVERKVALYFNNFASNQPVTSTGNCIAVSANDGYQWVTKNCDDTAPFLCTTAEPVTTPTANVTTTTIQPDVTTAVPVDPVTDPNFGASTGNSGGLSSLWIAVIIVIIIIILAVILAIALLVYYKKANKQENAVVPSKYDARPKAPIPIAGAVEVSDDSITNSTTGLVLSPGQWQKSGSQVYIN